MEAGRWAQEPTEHENGTEGFLVGHRPSPTPGIRVPAQARDAADKIQCWVAYDYLDECPYQTPGGVSAPPCHSETTLSQAWSTKKILTIFNIYWALSNCTELFGYIILFNPHNQPSELGIISTCLKMRDTGLKKHSLNDPKRLRRETGEMKCGPKSVLLSSP